MNTLLPKVLLTAAICGTTFFSASTSYGQTQDVGDNIALHQKVTVDPPSNYVFTKNRDPQQLTDGIYASGNAKWDPENKTRSLWVQDGCIGWTIQEPVITIDLGSVQPISGLIYSTAGGGNAGVTWPDHIYISTSNDNKTWHYAGDLVKLSQKNGTPPASGYANFRYVTHDLKTHGRYITLGIVQKTYVFTDEIEVLRGDDALLQQSAGKKIPTMRDFAPLKAITNAAEYRQNTDIAEIRADIQNANLSSSKKSTFNARLGKAATATREMALLPVDFKTIIPITDIHRDILAVHGEALAAQGVKPLTVWKKHRYAWLPLLHKPDTKNPVSLDFSMLKNQFRSDAILLTNASGKPLTVRVQLKNPPSGTQEGWLQLDSAIWTDTKQRIPVQDALMPMKNENGSYSMEIPPGVTGKLWVTIDSSKIPAGVSKSTFEISGAGQKASVPMSLDISSISMGKPRMSLGMWDYTNGKGSFGITEDNRKAAIKLMRSHFVDPPWGSSSTFPTPTAKDFDAKNQLITELNFSQMDQWLSMWPDARRYFVFRNVRNRDEFAGAKMGTPEFNAKVGSWAKAIAANFLKNGVKPSQVAICPVDETRNNQFDLHLLSWAKAIKTAVPEFLIFSDPIWEDPTKAKYPEAFMIADILSPHPGWTPEFYEKYRTEHNKEIWLYNGYGLGRLGDPQLGYRQMAWRVFSVGGMGEGFWSFGDISGAATSWNEYSVSRPTYAPAFIDKDTVHNSIHWDAVREGVEDFEELSMLQDAINKSNDAALKAEAQQVLDDAVKTVNDNAESNKKHLWREATDPTVVDAQLARVRRMLERIG